MKEIEIKLRAHDLDSVVAKLVRLGCEISPPTVQEDRNFVHTDDVYWFEGGNSQWTYPRLRIQNGKPLKFTVKKPVENQMSCTEHEIQIDNPDELEGIMRLFGYINGVRVKKSRRETTYNDYSITLDEVEDLGTFIEIERVVEDGDAQQIQEEMFRFAKETFNLDRDDQVMKGYDILMHFKQNE